MTLFNLVKKNVIGNIRNYLLYFVSMILSVVIYYTFVSLQYSKEIQDNIELSTSLRNVFNQASIILIVFVAVFILYSNSFFTRKRKNEIGLFSLLGVRKRTIGKMLLYENTLIGALALCAGIFLGTLLSKLFTMILLALIDYPVEVSFTVSVTAIVQTSLVFALINLFTSVQSYRLIYRFELIELFRADKEGEPMPKASFVTAALAVLLLVFGYWLALQPMTTNEIMLRNFLLILIAIVCGTFMLFRSAILLLLISARKNKSSYYRGMNLIGTSQLLYRIKGNARMLATISLLSAITLSAFSTGYSAYYGNAREAEQLSPFSFMHQSGGESFDRQVRGIITADQEHPLSSELDVPIMVVDTNISELDYQGSGLPPEGAPIKVIAASTYNEAAHILGSKERVHLSQDEAVVIRPMFTDFTASDFTGRSIVFQQADSQVKVTFVDMVTQRIMNWSYPDVMVIVNDSQFAALAQTEKLVFYKAFKVDDEITTELTSEALKSLSTEEAPISSFYATYTRGLQSAGIDIFTLGFLGLVFLAATGSLIYFKQLTEASADRKRYEILRKIGVSRREVRSSIAKQVLFVFALPLVVAIAHSVLILRVSMEIQLITQDLIFPIAASMGAFLIIYLIYYMITVQSFKRIVQGARGQ